MKQMSCNIGNKFKTSSTTIPLQESDPNTPAEMLQNQFSEQHHHSHYKTQHTCELESQNAPLPTWSPLRSSEEEKLLKEKIFFVILYKLEDTFVGIITLLINHFCNIENFTF